MEPPLTHNSLYLAVPTPSCSRSPSPTPSSGWSDQNSESDMLHKAASIITVRRSKQSHDFTDGQVESAGHRRPSKKRSFGDMLSRSFEKSTRTSSIPPSGFESPSSRTPSPSNSLLRTKASSSKLVRARMPRRAKRSIPKWEPSQVVDNTPSINFSARLSYIQGYSAMSLANDFQTSELLTQFYPSAAPTFYPFSPANIPRNVLDLGCGLRGTWVIEAATHWRAYHTKVTGLDIMEPELWQVHPSIRENVRYIQGDFLSRLPFENESFDFVRMANLGLCIPHFCWKEVMEEVHRVLRPGGIIEVIDDELLWPYMPSPPTSLMRLMSSFLSSPYQDDDDEGEPVPTRPMDRNVYEDFDSNVSVSHAMEDLFEKMIWFKHGIHPRPHQFIQDLVIEVFGENATRENNFNQPRVFKVALPCADFGIRGGDAKGDRSRFGSLFSVEWKNYSAETSNPISVTFNSPDSLPGMIPSKAAQRLFGTSDPTRRGIKREIPGLLLYTEKDAVDDGIQYSGHFASMHPTRMEMSICKHMHVLLCCRKALTDFICEAQNGDNVMTDEEISSAFWTYECFRRMRFNLPLTLNELKMEEDEETQSTPSYRLSNDSGYSSLYSRNDKPSKTALTDITSQESEGHTCVRVIRVFQGTKTREPA